MIVSAIKKVETRREPSETSKVYFGNLDAIRFIAALMVYLQHGISKSYEFLPIQGTYLEGFLYTISSGATGVSIFFVLSGFLITYLLISEYEYKSTINIKNFYLRRILRIWPLYFMVVFFAFLLYPGLKEIIGINNPLGSNIFYHLTFLSNFDVIHINKNCEGMDAMSQNITWSVSVEEQFYLFWPLLFFVFNKKYWLYAILFMIVGSIVFRLINFSDGHVLYFHTFSVLLDLGIGGLLALLVKQNSRIRLFFENISSRGHTILIFLSIALLFGKDEILHYKYGMALSRVLTATSFAMVICAQAVTKSNSKLNFKNLGFASQWGKYTYGIYMLHPIAITIFDILLRLAHIEKNSFIVTFGIGLAGFFLTLLMSRLSYVHFESKFLRIKEKYAVIKTTK